MSFKIDDRVQWTNVNDGGTIRVIDGGGRGTVTEVDHALEKVYVRWDNGDHGWLYFEDMEHVDAVTRLGEVADDRA